MPPFRPRSRRSVLAAGLAVCLFPHPGEAHAILEASEPNVGGTIPAGPITLNLRFNSRIDRTRSRLTLIRPDKTRADLPIAAAGPPDVLTATVTLTPGPYVVRWQVLAIDGHITRGDVPFSVTGP